MATDKKAISAYIPSDIEEYLTKYCTEYDITRKDKSGEAKPALGTAVVEILRIFFSSDNVPSPLPDNVPLLPSNVVTEDKLNRVLSNLKTSSNTPGTLPSNVITKDNASNVLNPLLDDIRKELDLAIADEVSKIRTELQPILDTHKKTEELLAKVNTLVTGLDTQHEDIQTITKVDKKSLARIFETSEDESKDTQKQSDNISISSPTPVVERENKPNTEVKVNWENKTVKDMKNYIKENNLNEAFGKFAGHGIRGATKAEFVNFLNSQS